MKTEPIYGGFSRRVYAMIIDAVVFSPFIFLAYLTWAKSLTAFVIGSMLSFICYTVYEVIFLRKYGATIGKSWAGIKVESLSGEPLSWQQAIFRNSVGYLLSLFGLISHIAFATQHPELFDLPNYWAFAHQLGKYRPDGILALIPVLNGIWVWSEFIVLLTNKKRRAIHDFIAGTVVIQNRVFVKPFPLPE